MQGFKRPIKTSCWTIYQYQDLIWPSDSQQSQFTVKSKLGLKKKTKNHGMSYLDRFVSAF